MDYGKVLFDGFEFDDDSQGTIRASLSQEVFDSLISRNPQGISTVRYGDVYYQPILPESEKDNNQARLFFRVNFETNELRFCAEAVLNEPQSPLFYADYHMHSVVVESNILRRGFDLGKAVPDQILADNSYMLKFSQGNELFKSRIVASDYKRVLTTNIKRHLCYSFERPVILDEIIVIGFDKVRDVFREVIFFGDSVTEMESAIYAFRQELPEGIIPEYSPISRFEAASLLLGTHVST